ncbi:MAG TPA: hypothetical protein VLK84_05145, partial [Longimicrobium sp.]|nr:hypothetical protein [Longimicrobium sp.]
MIASVRASLAAVVALVWAGSSPVVAQQRECTPAERARVAWTPPPGVADDAWRATLLSNGLVTPETELVRIESDSLPGMGDAAFPLIGEMERLIQARVRGGPAKMVLLARVEPDSTLSRLLLALPSGMVAIEDSIDPAVRRLRFPTVVRDGCPIASWSPITFETSGAQTIPARPAPRPGAAGRQMVNLVSISRLRDEFAGRPGEASYREGQHARPWALLERPVTFPEPFRSNAVVAESFVLLDVDSAGHAAGCRTLRAGAHPALDELACPLLMRPGYFSASVVPSRQSLAGQWVMGFRWESLPAAAHRQRVSDFSGVAAAPAIAPPAGDHWVRVSRLQNGGAAFIDTASVRRVGEDVFQFTQRDKHPVAMTRRSDG